MMAVVLVTGSPRLNAGWTRRQRDWTSDGPVVTVDVPGASTETELATGQSVSKNRQECVRALIRSAGYLQPLTQLWSVCQHAPEFADLLPKVQALISQLQV
ncbi:hypothetical protein P879_00265 [Paragonimus westermani]|uniref:Uncharacterized protein n=1 Tax=Paragonimus westermani TaxID=34504 RepID=A0A8T0DW59_9TREM|nr:hypothetical protein P879_00265 [Paragonimus westermani]